HPRQGARGVCPPREAENVDVVVLSVVAREPGVGLFDVVLDAEARGPARDASQRLAELGDSAARPHGADPRVVVDQLLLRIVLQCDVEYPGDVGRSVFGLVVCAVQAQDEVSLRWSRWRCWRCWRCHSGTLNVS